MNTTEDGAEPVGEGPIDTLSAIERGAVLGVLHAADHITATTQLAQRQARAIEAIWALHYEYIDDQMDVGFCAECQQEYPCPTICALDEAGA